MRRASPTSYASMADQYQNRYSTVRRGPIVPLDAPPRRADVDPDDDTSVVPWKRIFRWMAIAVAVGVLLLILLDKVVMPWYVKLGAEAKVPGVVGMTYPDAAALLRKKGFEVKRAEPRYSEKVPAGIVMMQLPYGGATTKEGRRIYLTESRGVELIPMPDLLGRPLREARITLMRQGFEVGDISYDFNDTMMRDLIYFQGVPKDVGARPGTIVDLMVSQGPTNRYIMMPNLVGLTLDEARNRIESAGLTIGVVRKKRSEFDKDVVIEQSAAPYTQVSEKGGISITISDPNAPLADADEAATSEPIKSEKSEVPEEKEK